MTGGYEKALPPEQWQQILAYVPPWDLCSVVLVSRYMHNVASCPDLWEGINVNAEKVRKEGLAQFYSISRFNKITSIDVSRTQFTTVNGKYEELERLLNDIPGTPLESINLTLTNLSNIPVELLTNAVSNLTSANLQYTSMTTDQCIHILEANRSSRKLINLNLGQVQDLDQVPSELLASSISSLRSVGLGFTRLTTEQLTAVLDAILSSSTLVSADLDLLDFSGVPADLLGRAVSRLHTVDINTAFPSTAQCVAVLEAAISSETLAHVNMWKADLTEVPPQLLAEAVSCLQTVELGCTKLTTEQCLQLVQVCQSARTLVKVGLTGTNFGEMVPAELLATLPPHVSL